MSDEQKRALSGSCNKCGTALVATFVAKAGDRSDRAEAVCPGCDKRLTFAKHPGEALFSVVRAKDVGPPGPLARVDARSTENGPPPGQRADAERPLADRGPRVQDGRAQAARVTGKPRGSGDSGFPLGGAGGTEAGDPFFDQIFGPEILEGLLKGMRDAIDVLKRDVARLAGEVGALKTAIESDRSSGVVEALFNKGIKPIRQNLEVLYQELKAIRADQAAAGEAGAAPAPPPPDASVALEARLDRFDRCLDDLSRRSEAESEAAAAVSSLREDLRDLEGRLLADGEARLGQLPEVVSRLAREFLADRAGRLDRLVFRLPDLFDVVHDEWRFWHAGTELNGEEAVARVHILPVLDEIERGLEDWRKRCGIRRDDPLAQGTTTPVKFDEWEHVRISGEFTPHEEEDQTIKEVAAVGYRWHDQTLRKPQVVVRTLRKSFGAAGAPAAPGASAASPPSPDASAEPPRSSADPPPAGPPEGPGAMDPGAEVDGVAVAGLPVGPDEPGRGEDASSAGPVATPGGEAQP